MTTRMMPRTTATMMTRGTEAFSFTLFSEAETTKIGFRQKCDPYVENLFSFSFFLLKMCPTFPVICDTLIIWFSHCFLRCLDIQTQMFGSRNRNVFGIAPKIAELQKHRNFAKNSSAISKISISLQKCNNDATCVGDPSLYIQMYKSKPVREILFSWVNPDDPWTFRASTAKAYSMFGSVATTWEVANL